MENTQQKYIIGAGLSNAGFDYVFTTALNKTDASNIIKKLFIQFYIIEKEKMEFGFSKPSHFSPKDIKRLFKYGISVDAFFYSKYPLESIIKVEKLINGYYVDDTKSFTKLIAKEIENNMTELKKLEVNSKKETPKKLSKAGQWMQKNKGGIMTVTDWKAVNK